MKKILFMFTFILIGITIISGCINKNSIFYQTNINNHKTDLGDLSKENEIKKIPINYSDDISPKDNSCEKLWGEYLPQKTPKETVQLELNLLSQGIYCYNLPIFDPEWRKRGDKIIHSSQYKKTFQKFNVPSEVYIEGDHAIIYFPQNKSVGPEFLYKESNIWILDRTAVWDYIHYNYSNSGWFAYEDDYVYLNLLKKIFPMEKIKLDSGVWAYQIK